MLPEGTQRIAFGSENYRTVVKDAAGDTLDVDMVPRRRIRLALAEGLELPTGLGVHAISPLAADGRAAWSGNGTELPVDGEGACQVQIRSATVERSRQVVLWSGTLEVPAEAGEPPTIVLPLDAAAIVALREQLAHAPKR